MRPVFLFIPSFLTMPLFYKPNHSFLQTFFQTFEHKVVFRAIDRLVEEFRTKPGVTGSTVDANYAENFLKALPHLSDAFVRVPHSPILHR